VSSLYSRGAKLLRESLLAGVTSLRAHVEVDEQVGLKAVLAAERLKVDWEGKIDIQISGQLLPQIARTITES
jgi:cytosine/adenosine deaminase-related metal-dependent hydrolase